MTRFPRPTTTGSAPYSSRLSTPITGGGPPSAWSRCSRMPIGRGVRPSKPRPRSSSRSSTPRPSHTWTRQQRRSWRSFPNRSGPSSARRLATPVASQSEEQKRLLASNPRVNISAGVLYQYDQAAADDLKKEQAKVAAKRAEKPVEDFVSVLDEVPGVVPTTKIFHRGDHRQPTKAGAARRPHASPRPRVRDYDIPDKDTSLSTSGRRLAYARHLVKGDHPLTGRVLVNRIWLNHFGRGLVDTPGDFGVLGTRPTHPELLDWLADELVRQGWSLKRMHKLIMTSTVYRQSITRQRGGCDR